MEYQKFDLKLYGTSLYGWYTQPNTLKGVVVLVHGMGEHSGRYLNSVIPKLLESGMAVVAYDNIGHGKSGGKRGHCPNYKALMDILEAVLLKARTLFSEKPLFLYGHSMGGNLVLNYALRHDFEIDGLVVSSPYLRLAFVPPKWKMVLGKIMLHIFPSLTLPSGLDARGISRIAEEVKAYKADELIHDKVSPMFSFPIMDAGEWVIQNANRLKVKTLLLHGTADPIIDHKATISFHEMANHSSLKLYEGGYHELHHDRCKDEVLAHIQDWFQEQLTAS
ncbi:alpha/beta hydrolase [Spongiimicrobium salis]|uniref:alpha/beta hydrolase n=1 Tax=Spongiimicrobium salis TaxID=1667022 RepID=UPI00374CD353